MFAGPNGSGKSTIYEYVASHYRSGHFVNADYIDQIIRSGGRFKLAPYELRVTPAGVRAALEGLSWRETDVGRRALGRIRVGRGPTLHVTAARRSYEAAVIADLLRSLLLQDGQSFSLETVMSHPSKIAFLQTAKDLGYSCYLYFVSTVAPLINVERVKARVRKGGHSVPEKLIETRYKRSHALLSDAIALCYRSFLFDNSDKAVGESSSPEGILFLEFKNGRLRKTHREPLRHWMKDQPR